MNQPEQSAGKLTTNTSRYKVTTKLAPGYGRTYQAGDLTSKEAQDLAESLISEGSYYMVSIHLDHRTDIIPERTQDHEQS